MAQLLNAADDGVLRYPKTVAVPEGWNKEHQNAYRHGYYLGWNDCLQRFYFEGKKGFFIGMGWNRRYGRPLPFRSTFECEFTGRFKGFEDCSRIIKNSLKNRSVKDMQAICRACYFPSTWKNLNSKDLAKAKSSFARRESPSRWRHIPPRVRTEKEIALEKVQRELSEQVLTKEKSLLEFHADLSDPDWAKIKRSFRGQRIEFDEIGSTMCAYGDQDLIDKLRKQLVQVGLEIR